MRPIIIAAVAAALLTGSAPAEKVRFCPQDGRFCGPHFPADGRGVCRACGRITVELEACVRTWQWCSHHGEWHTWACPQHSMMRCCEARESQALRVASDVTALMQGAYCPECRKPLAEADVDVNGACTTCGKPPVAGEFVTRQWFWCTAHELWHEARCGDDCCSERRVAVLACACGPPGNICAAGRDEAEVLVTTDWLEEHLGDPGLVVVQVGFPWDAPDALVRTAYREGHIRGARLLPWNALAIRRHGCENEFPPLAWMTAAVRRLGIDEDSRIVLYDTAWGLEAARAYVMLDYLGLGARASILDGQWPKWHAELRDIEAGVTEVERSAFVPRPRAETLVTLAEMRDLVWLARQKPTTVSLIDARPEEQYADGRIPGAENLPCLASLRMPFSPEFRDASELREMFESAGARPGRTVVAYCATGTEAPLVYVAAKHLGYPARFYDGSFEEWSRRANVERD